MLVIDWVHTDSWGICFQAGIHIHVSQDIEPRSRFIQPLPSDSLIINLTMPEKSLSISSSLHGRRPHNILWKLFLRLPLIVVKNTFPSTALQQEPSSGQAQFTLTMFASSHFSLFAFLASPGTFSAP